MTKDNGSPNNNPFLNKGKGGIVEPNDAGYLQWARLGANDKQLLAIRDELRAHRENAPIHEENARQHEKMQMEFMYIMKMLAYAMLLLSRAQGKPSAEDVEKLRIDSQEARNAMPDPEEVVAILRINDAENLSQIAGLHHSINTTDDGQTWIVQLREGSQGTELGVIDGGK